MNAYEKLGAFYLGKEYDFETRSILDSLLLYDSKDLTTNAVCVGMTGSGKTGLCLSLLEEAAIDRIPTLAIDPKGDLGNLLLTFPGLAPQDFRPWIDEEEAERKGSSPDEYAVKVSGLWRNGLADWGQDGDRIARFRDAVDLAIYTPGSSAGLPLTVLRSFSAPPPALREDTDAFRDRITGAVSGLLGLLGIQADPLRSREHILVASILSHFWERGQDLDLAGLIQNIQSPPLDKIGVMDVESFFPSKDRFELSMNLNNLLASPGFSTWMEGDPLDIQRLLWADDGRPRVSILSIAHLSEQERMFFVTLLLNEVLAWLRTQSGTSSLRALLYMDEIFGYFPPSANPPSKKPMLTLLKQGRAYGLGTVLTTQNPVDLDYKGLSNTGTWFLGRLQTERDKARVLEGLEGVSAEAGSAFDRKELDRLLSGLKSRVFLMQNVHENEPVLFHTRWALSYLRGPLTRSQIGRLMEGRKSTAPAPAKPPAAVLAQDPPPDPAGKPAPSASPRPLVPSGIREFFLPSRVELTPGSRLVYRPALLGRASLHYVRTGKNIDHWTDSSVLSPARGSLTDPWKHAEPADDELELETVADPRGQFGEVPGPVLRVKSYGSWEKKLATHLYRTRSLTIWHCRSLKETSEPEESEKDFRIRLAQKAREKRDEKRARLEKKYRPKFTRIQERIRKAEARLGREQEQYQQQKLQTAVSLGATVLGALFGRKVASTGTVGRATTTMRGVGRASRERGDIARAQRDIEAQAQRLADLEAQFQEEIAELEDLADPTLIELEEVEIRPRKSDITDLSVDLVWIPWKVAGDGIAEPAHR